MKANKPISQDVDPTPFMIRRPVLLQRHPFTPLSPGNGRAITIAHLISTVILHRGVERDLEPNVHNTVTAFNPNQDFSTKAVLLKLQYCIGHTVRGKIKGAFLRAQYCINVRLPAIHLPQTSSSINLIKWMTFVATELLQISTLI